MKRAVLAFVLFTVSARAQQPCGECVYPYNPDPPCVQKCLTRNFEKMSATLQLTPEQKKEVAPIVMGEGPKLKALKSDSSLSPTEQIMKQNQITDDTDKQLHSILNAEQYQKLHQMRAQEQKRTLNEVLQQSQQPQHPD